MLIVPQNHEIVELYPESMPLDVFARYQIIWREPGFGASQVVETALAEAHITAPANTEVMGVAGVKESVRYGPVSESALHPFKPCAMKIAAWSHGGSTRTTASAGS